MLGLGQFASIFMSYCPNIKIAPAINTIAPAISLYLSLLALHRPPSTSIEFFRVLSSSFEFFRVLWSSPIVITSEMASNYKYTARLMC